MLRYHHGWSATTGRSVATGAQRHCDSTTTGGAPPRVGASTRARSATAIAPPRVERHHLTGRSVATGAQRNCDSTPTGGVLIGTGEPTGAKAAKADGSERPREEPAHTGVRAHGWRADGCDKLRRREQAPPGGARPRVRACERAWVLSSTASARPRERAHTPRHRPPRVGEPTGQTRYHTDITKPRQHQQSHAPLPGHSH